jgi:hypothetical protein
MPRKDINQTAFDIVQQAAGERIVPEESAKAAAGRKGGLIGGAKRAQTLSPEKRSAAAKKAAEARWRSRKS